MAGKKHHLFAQSKLKLFSYSYGVDSSNGVRVTVYIYVCLLTERHIGIILCMMSCKMQKNSSSRLHPKKPMQMIGLGYLMDEEQELSKDILQRIFTSRVSQGHLLWHH